MSEMRWNPVLREWVVTATHRQDRTYKPPPDFCPLCPTETGAFPTEVPASDYQMVVFENKFPAFRRNAEVSDEKGTELYTVAPAQGICEVVLYTPGHEGSLTDYPPSHIRKVIELWTDRYRELGSYPFVKYVFIFENKGEVVGVTLHHPHGQIYAFPFVPPRIQTEIESDQVHRERTGRCLFCDVVEEEMMDGRRVILQTEAFAAVVPFYARYPYEVHIFARQHHSSLIEFTDNEKDELSHILKGVLVKYDNLFNISFPYMMVLHQAPTDGGEVDFHFHIEFYPPMRSADKLKYLAGCESGAGTYVNDSNPEEKAVELKNCAPHSVEEIEDER
ncbi:MAG: galactose-1-phosphate uridylyltransferase [bacterium]